MFDFFTFIFGFASGVIITWIWTRYQPQSPGASSRADSFDLTNRQATAQKGIRKDIILTLFKSRKTITNSDVEKLLEVSDATATNYLQELEGEGKIIQVGRTGRSVSYKLKQTAKPMI